MAASPQHAVCQGLLFSCGVEPVEVVQDPEDWRAFAARWLRENHLDGPVAMLVAGPSPRNPSANHRIEFMPV